MPRSVTRSSRIASTWSWTVTSSAEVGSSAIIRSGSPASIMAIITRWPMPPDSSWGHEAATRRGSRIRTADSSSRTRPRASRPRRPRWSRRLSAICSPTRITGLSEYFGSCSTMPIRPPRRSRHWARVALRRSIPSNSMRSAVTTAECGSSPMIARPTVDLPDPLSPTMPSFSRPTARDTPRTAATGPVRVAKATRRFSIVSTVGGRTGPMPRHGARAVARPNGVVASQGARSWAASPARMAKIRLP